MMQNSSYQTSSGCVRSVSFVILVWGSQGEAGVGNIQTIAVAPQPEAGTAINMEFANCDVNLDIAASLWKCIIARLLRCRTAGLV